MDSPASSDESRAAKLLNAGKTTELRMLLAPYLAIHEDWARFYAAQISSSPYETDEEFEQRSIEEIRQLADASYAPAMFALGCCLETGDLLPAAPREAAKWFESAASAGLSKAKYRHGLNLYFGSNGIPQLMALGKTLIVEACKSGVEEAEGFCREHNWI